MKPAYLGVDLGGTNIYTVAFDEEWNRLKESKIDTEAKKGYQHVIIRLRDQIETVEKALKEQGYSMTGVGVGVPGIVSPSDEVIKVAPNLGWSNVRLLHDLGLKERVGIRTVLMNDVNAGLLGELTRMHKVPSMVIAYFCGTGIGGALALNGRLVTGFDGGTGEVGHMVVKEGGAVCSCGRRGCLEAYIGKWALNEKILKRLESGKKTLLKKFIHYNLKKVPVKSESLKKGLEQEDPFAVDLMEGYYSRYLAAGISQAVNLLNPDLVILGGGIMESMGIRLLSVIYKNLIGHCINTPPQLMIAQLGDLAGPVGAAAMVRSI